MKPGVFITFDVECSMGGAWGDPKLKPVSPNRTVWGKYGDQQYGLPWIVDILEQNQLNATFFVETFMEEQGHPEHGEPICRYLLEHDQDVQLHIHPNHRHYGLKQQGCDAPFNDNIAELSPGDQLALIREGVDRIHQWTGRRPVAFRAGNMGASEETLRQLAAAGIAIDSSYTFPYLGKSCHFIDSEFYNGAKWYGSVLEMALSGFRQNNLVEWGRPKPLDLMGISFEECRDAIRQINDAGCDAVMILHSFSLFKVRNVQYDGGRKNWIVARRFRRFCNWLAKEHVPVYTFETLAKQIANKTYQAKHAQPCLLNHPRGTIRKVVQAWNRMYWT
jgi:peptidoglycan/xylan/chitin deacetylase (PgdA/CDA1 family)